MGLHHLAGNPFGLGQDSLNLIGATLRTNKDDAISDRTALTISRGGVLDLGGRTEYVRAINIINGSVINGTLLVSPGAALDLSLGDVGGLSKGSNVEVASTGVDAPAASTATGPGMFAVADPRTLPPSGKAAPLPQPGRAPTVTVPRRTTNPAACDAALQASNPEALRDQLGWLWESGQSGFARRSKKNAVATAVVDQLMAMSWR